MTDNNTNFVEQSSVILLLKYIISKWFFILIITIVCGALGYGFSVWRAVPEYTARHTLIFKTSISEEDIKNLSATEMTLAKIYLPTAEENIKSPACEEKANKIYQEMTGDTKGIISKGNIGISYGSNSLIFKISYRSTTEKSAKLKLEAVIAAAKEILAEEGISPAKEVTLVPVQREITCTPTNSTAKTKTLYGAIIGFAVSVVLFVILFFLDNTVTTSEELEALTNSNVLAYVGQHTNGKYGKYGKYGSYNKKNKK